VSPGDPLLRWDWFPGHLDEIAFRLAQHVAFTVVAVAVGFGIAFVLALLAIRWRALYGPITAVAGVLYAIPSVALFFLFIGITGLSFLTAEIALVGYTLLILVRNIVAGVDGVAAEVREAAEGMGYGRWRRLWRVELPIALPVIIAGLRVATVSTIGLVAVTALLGRDQGGLGVFIVEGRERFFATPLVVGAVLSVALAIAADGLFVFAQRLVTPWARGQGS